MAQKVLGQSALQRLAQMAAQKKFLDAIKVTSSEAI
jgi:hypothetical protein